MNFNAMFRVSAYFVVLSGVLAFEAPRGTLAGIAAFAGLSAVGLVLRRKRVFFPPKSRNEKTAVLLILMSGGAAVLLFGGSIDTAVFRAIFFVQVVRFFSADRAGH